MSRWEPGRYPDGFRVGAEGLSENLQAEGPWGQRGADREGGTEMGGKPGAWCCHPVRKGHRTDGSSPGHRGWGWGAVTWQYLAESQGFVYKTWR